MKNQKQKPKLEDKSSVTWSKDSLISIFLFFTAFLIYANTLGHGFVLDDPLSINLNENVTKGFSGIWDIITGSYRENNFGGQLYRPVSLIQFAVEWSFLPENPMIHHFFNVFWFGACVVLSFKVLRHWLPDVNILLPFTIAFLFAVHPIHTEVVANIKSRDEIMSLFFLFGSFYYWHLFHKKQGVLFLIMTICSYFLALISKESAVTMFPVFGLLSWYLYRSDVKTSIKHGLYLLLPVILLFVIRHSLFSQSPDIPVDIMDNPIVAVKGTSELISTSLFILGKYLFLLFLPFKLSSDYSYIVIPNVGFGNLWVWISLIIHSSLGIWSICNIKKRNLLSLLILAYLGAIFLFSQLPMIIGTMFGERLAFLPSFWFLAGIVCFAWTFFVIPKDAENQNILTNLRIHKLPTVIFLIIGLLFSFKVIIRNLDWKDNFTLFTTDSATYPSSIRLQNGAADSYYNAASLPGIDPIQVAKMLERAEYHCQEIFKIRPVATAYLTMGNIRMKQKNYTEAISYYDQVNDLKSIVDANKALVYREMGRDAGEKEQNLVKAEEMLKKSLSLNDSDAETWFLMGVLSGIRNNHAKAAEYFEKAYSLNQIPQYAKSAVMAFKNLGDEAKAVEYEKYAK